MMYMCRMTKEKGFVYKVPSIGGQKKGKMGKINRDWSNERGR